MKTTLIAAAMTVATFAAAPASAAIVSNIGSGQNFCESQNRSVFGAAYCDLGGNADLSNSTPTADHLTFLSSGNLGGYVADARGVNNSNYPDYATITLSSASMVTMSLVRPDQGFDAAFTFGALANATLNAANSTVTFFAAAGSYAFGIDATNPTNSPTRVASSYELSVSAVPLPAGALLMLTGLGGLVASRRRKRAA